MEDSCAQHKLDNIQKQISEVSRKAFDQQYDHILKNTTEETQQKENFQKDAIELSLETATEFAKEQIKEVLREIGAHHTPPEHLRAVNSYLEKIVLTQLKIYSHLYPCHQLKNGVMVEVPNTTKPETTMEEEIRKPFEMSEEVKKAIETMNEIAAQHEDVYPPLIKPGTMVIPTGRLAKCQCKPDCQVDLAEPEYRVISDEELKRRWQIDGKVDTKKNGKNDSSNKSRRKKK